MSVTVEVRGEPVAKARPRMTKTGHVYTPARTETAEAMIRRAWIEWSGGGGRGYGPAKKFSGPIFINLEFCYAPPASWRKSRREMAERYRLPKETKPDVDNLVKTVLDALNGVAYEDDKQVYAIRAVKHYDPRGPHTRIRITPFEELHPEAGWDDEIQPAKTAADMIMRDWWE